jgi:Family of unknown function (DUF5758)/Pentapeptide repeats (8 copies)
VKIQIKHRFNGSVLFETDAETIGAAVAAAIAAKANLRYANLSSANLRYADLSYANLSYADLSYADLSYADLRYANLSSANLRYANLSSANLSSASLSSANLLKILSIRTIVPQEGDFIAWKKLTDGVVCKLRIPSEAKRIGGLVGRKCRAEFAMVLGPSGVASKNDLKYIKGKMVKPDKFDPNPLVECSNGIHFFITEQEAKDYEP